MEDYGLALKILRKHFSLTQQDLADKIGVSKHAVSKWETGVNQPDIQTLRSICEVFGISTEEFFRIASGETVEEVLKSKTENESCIKNKRLTLRIIALALIPISIIFIFVGCFLGLQENKPSSESLPSIIESMEFGEEIKGNKNKFLAEINSAITLSDGISEYDIVGNLECDGQMVATLSYKLVIDKKSGAISRFFVSDISNGIDAYCDMLYAYTEKDGEKVRFDESDYDLIKYVEDIEEYYLLEDLIYLKAYKKGYVKQYHFGFSEGYAKTELEEFFEEVKGVILTNCQGVMIVSSDGMTEKNILEFSYQGREYTFTATRQLSKNSEFTFPNFNEYQKPADCESLLSEVDGALSKTQKITNYSKVIYQKESQIFSFETSDKVYRKSVAKVNGKTIYYSIGKIYDQTSDYNGTYKYYRKASYDDYYAYATQSLKDFSALFDMQLSLTKEHISTAIRKQEDGSVICRFYLNEKGVEHLESTLDIWLYAFDSSAEVVFKIKDGIITAIEIKDDDGVRYKLEFTQAPTVNLPDLTAYKLIIDKNTATINVKSSEFNSYYLNYETVVDYSTGDIYVIDYKTLKRYDKKHNLLREYPLTVSGGYNVGGIIGVYGNSVYYTAFDGYYFDISEDNKLYVLNLSTGECRCESANYNYTKMPVAVYQGLVVYSVYRSATYGSKLDLSVLGNEFSSTYFLYYDVTNSLLVFDAYKYNEDGSKLYVYDFKTGTLSGEDVESNYRNEEYLVGEGFYDYESGEFYKFSEIGKTRKTSYFGVIDNHPKKEYSSPTDARWQIVKDTDKYTFTTMGVYEKSTGNFIYFPEKVEYRFFSGGVHVWAYQRYSFTAETKTLYTFFF